MCIYLPCAKKKKIIGAPCCANAVGDILNLNTLQDYIKNCKLFSGRYTIHLHPRHRGSLFEGAENS